LLSLFDPDYKPINGLAYLCAFGIVHPSLTFIFDDHHRGLEGMYIEPSSIARDICSMKT